MHQGFRTLLHPTAVTACCEVRYRPGKAHLCVAKTTVLEVYELRAGTSQPLSLEKVYTLHGVIEAMAAVQLPGKQGESLILGFGEAKLSVMEWDPRSNDLQVKALHLLEEPELAEGRVRREGGPKAGDIRIRVDPGGPARPSQCIAVLVHRRFLFVLPFARRQTGGLHFAASKEEAAPFPLEAGSAPIDLQAKGIAGVRDICFLAGLYNPTVLVLHEQTPTWSGRLMLRIGDDPRAATRERRALTCAATALSLTLGIGRAPDTTPLRLHSRLPYNATSLLPMTTTPHGALCVGPNTLFHVAASRETQGYAAHVNRFGEDELRSDAGLTTPRGEAVLQDVAGNPVQCLAPAEGKDGGDAEVRLVLDLSAAHVQQLDPVRFLLVMQDGDAALLHLTVANGVVTKMFLTVCGGLQPFAAAQKGRDAAPAHLPSCPSPSCMTSIGEARGVVFVGSRTGDSVLLARTPWDPQHGGVTFERLCSLLNTAPVVDLALGDSSTDPFSAGDDDDDMPDCFPAPTLQAAPSGAPLCARPSQHATYSAWAASQEAVLATGCGKDGAVCVVNRTVKPLELCRMAMRCEAAWTVRLGGKPRSMHDLIVLAPEGDALRLMACREDQIVEVGASALPGLQLTGQTVLVAQMMGGQCIVQVTTTDCVLMDRFGNAISTHDVVSLGDRTGARVHVAVAGRDHVVLHMTNGGVALATVEDHGRGQVRMSLKQPRLTGGLGYITACHIYDAPHEDPYFCSTAGSERRSFAAVAWTTGIVQLYLLPSFRCLFHTEGVFDWPTVMAHINPDSHPDAAHELPAHHVRGIWLGRVESSDPAPYMFLLTDDEELHCYKGFTDEGALRQGAKYGMLSTLRWQKYVHSYFGRQPSLNVGVKKPGAPAAATEQRARSLQILRSEEGQVTDVFVDTPQQPHFTSFSGVFGLEGVFCRGVICAAWAFSERGYVRVHHAQEDEDGPASFFAPLDCDVCPGGFLCGHDATVKVSQLTWHRRMNFRAPLPTRKILLRSSPHAVAFDREHRTYTLAVSQPAPFRPVKTAFDRECDSFVEERDNESKMPEVGLRNGIPQPTTGRFELLLYSALTWRPFSSIALKENEQVMCLTGVLLAEPAQRLVPLESMRGQTLPKGRVALQACGTAFSVSEDVPCRGRLLLLRVRGGRHRDDSVLDVEHEHTTKGPVSAICASEGYLLVTIGVRVNVFHYDWHHKKLVLCTWCESGTFSVGMAAGIKNYVLCSDMFFSTTMMKLEELPSHSLSVVARDMNRINSCAADFMVDRSMFGVISSDDNGNLSLHQVQRKVLTPVADAHIGQSTSRFVRLNTVQTGDTAMGAAGRRTAVLFGTTGGAIMVCQPLSEATFRSVLWLHGKLCSGLPHPAGLHPRAFRLFSGRRRKVPEAKKRSMIVDLDLIIDRFGSQGLSMQQDLAVSAGLQADRVTNTLVLLLKEAPFL